MCSGSRPSVHETYMAVARVIAKRSTCVRRQVGCVLVDEQGQLVATGYNGVARGHIHCTDAPCPGASLASGHGLEICEAVHAEQNAIIQARHDFTTAYCTTLPCPSCMKLFVNTTCKYLYYGDTYTAADGDAVKIARTGNILLYRR